MGAGAVGAGASASIEAASLDEVKDFFKDLPAETLEAIKAALTSSETPVPATDADIDIKASTLSGELLAALKVPSSCTVRALKQKVAELSPDAEADKQVLICGDVVLAEDVIMKDMQSEGAGAIEVQVVLREPVELKFEDLKILLTEISDGEGKFVSFGFEQFSFSDKRQYGTYKMRNATDEDKVSWNSMWDDMESCTHSLTLRFSKELKRKKFPMTQDMIPVDMEKRTFRFCGEEE